MVICESVEEIGSGADGTSHSTESEVGSICYYAHEVLATNSDDAWLSNETIDRSRYLSDVA